MNEVLKRYYKTTKNRFYKKGLVFELNEYYNEIISNYVIQNNLSEEEMLVFVEYEENAFRNYIDRGSYDIDIRLYVKKIIDSYDYELAKNIFKIKEHEQSNLKVLRRPKIK